MDSVPILTIAVPTFNMEWCLEKNLRTYQDERLCGRLEVLCVNNASEDGSKAVIEVFCRETPSIFSLVDREVDDYGAAVNDALSLARGTYFRIVDADDWVDTEELVRLVDVLSGCEADVVLTDYRRVDLQDGSSEPIRACCQGAVYGTVYTSPGVPAQTLPSIHATTYRTALLQEHGFRVQTGMFFVDEEYVVLPYLYAETMVYYPFDVYRYLVANPAQSTSPSNRARYWKHREKVLCRLMAEYQAAVRNGADSARAAYCRKRIALGVGDHFTTLYMYVPDRLEGRKLAAAWKCRLLAIAPEFWVAARLKAGILHLLNRLYVPLCQYEKAKAFFLHGRLLLPSRKAGKTSAERKAK